MLIGSADMLRLVISGLVVLGFLLLPVASDGVSGTCPGHDGTTSHIVLTMAGQDGADPCSPHCNTTDAACCLAATSTLAPLILAAQVSSPSAPTLIRYWTRSDVGVGRTPEPDLAPPILHG
jgi:hypothetical protein